MKSNAGYRDRYDAKPRANIAFTLLPSTAFETANKIPEVAKTLVDRARHVAIVKGLNRNLYRVQMADSER